MIENAMVTGRDHYRSHGHTRETIGQCSECNEIIFDTDEYWEMMDGSLVHDDFDCLQAFLRKNGTLHA